MDAYANHIAVPSQAVRYLWDGDKLKGYHTCEDLGIPDGDEVDAMVDQQGC